MPEVPYNYPQITLTEDGDNVSLRLAIQLDPALGMRITEGRWGDALNEDALYSDEDHSNLRAKEHRIRYHARVERAEEVPLYEAPEPYVLAVAPDIVQVYEVVMQYEDLGPGEQIPRPKVILIRQTPSE